MSRRDNPAVHHRSPSPGGRTYRARGRAGQCRVHRPRLGLQLPGHSPGGRRRDPGGVPGRRGHDRRATSSCSPCPRLCSLRSRSCSAASPQTSADVSSISVGIAAAVVQVIGLMRWPLIVPSLADSDDTDAFDTVHTLLGTVVGETFGYLLTALWTVLIIDALGRRLAGRWFSLPRLRSGRFDRGRSSRAARRPGCRLRQLRRIHPLVGLDAHLRDPHSAAARAHRESGSNPGLGRDPGARRELLQPGLALRGVRNGVGAERDSASCRAPSTPWRCRRGTRPARPCRRGTPSGARTEPRSCLPCRSRAACP